MEKDQLTLSLGEHHVNHSQSLDSGKEWKTQEGILPSHFVQFLINLDPSGSFGKTCQVSSVVTKDGTLAHSSGRWQNSGMVHHTGCLTLKTSESHSDGEESLLSDILETGEPTAEVLFEPESLSWDSDKSRKKRKDSTSIPKGSTRVQGKGVATPLLHQDHIDALCARDYKGLNSDSLDKKAIVEVFENHGTDSRVKEMGDTCQNSNSKMGYRRR